MTDLRGEDFLRLDDVDERSLTSLLDDAAELKRRPVRDALSDRSLGMLFQKRSTRTRVSFEVGMTELGGHAVFLSSDDIQLGRGETVADTARALSRYVDVLMARVYDYDDVSALAEHSDVPVVNGLSDFNHPCQALSDAFTLRETYDDLDGVEVAWVGDGNNVCHSLLHLLPRLGVGVRVATPEGFEPDVDVVERARSLAVEPGYVDVVRDPGEAVEGVDAVYTDTWVSMGEEGKDVSVFENYRVDPELMSAADESAVFMHCLPAHRGQEVVDDVIDGPRSVVWRQAENRLHAQKALLVALAGD
ncbi:MAG: ornithine carbamoyltransferase [Halobacteriales archaeon]